MDLVSDSSMSPAVRPLRRQVSRACEGCRIRRAKCDNELPCRPCRRRNQDCVPGRGGAVAKEKPPRTAAREIERLAERCKQLEEELARYKRSSGPTSCANCASGVSYHQGSDGPSSVGMIDDVEDGPSAQSPDTSTAHHHNRLPVGIYTANPRTDRPSYYGPSSLFYYLGQIGGFLATSQDPQPTIPNVQTMHLQGVSSVLQSPTDMAPDSGVVISPSSSSGLYLPRQHEEYFLGLFWESHHASFPIVDEVAFRAHYDSLWQGGKSQRRDSALVDIIIALCMQQGFTFLFGPRGDQTQRTADSSNKEDTTIAGKWYYRRCQKLLENELETPDLTTVQCYIFSSVYLCCASFQNASHIAMAQAVRIAQIVGLHMEPPSHLPLQEQQQRRITWWCLWTVESKTCIKLGRPRTVLQSQIGVNLPSDSRQLATSSGSSLGSYDGVTWITFALCAHKLLLTANRIYDSLQHQLGKAAARDTDAATGKSVSGGQIGGQSLEDCATYMSSKTGAMSGWLDSLPPGIKTSRRGHGEPFSLDHTPLKFDSIVPRWLRRQRVCLELTYHGVSIPLYRPFIVFNRRSGTTAVPNTERFATSCLGHAIAYTLIMHQVVVETDLLAGWHEYFSWQWSAAITIIGFILSAPVNPAAADAWKAFDKSIAIFDLFAENFSVARSAATIARNLKSRAESLVSKLRVGAAGGMDWSPGYQSTLAAGCHDSVSDTAGFDSSSQVAQPVEGGFGAFMDWSLAVDFFGDLESLQDMRSWEDPSFEGL